MCSDPLARTGGMWPNARLLYTACSCEPEMVCLFQVSCLGGTSLWGADAMSGPVIAFVELLNRDALLIGSVDQGTFSCVHNLGMEHLGSTPAVVELESMTRSVDGHSESQTICSSAVGGFGRPSGPSRATAGKCGALHPAPSVKGRRRGASH